MSSWDKGYRLPNALVSKSIKENKQEGGKIVKKGFGMQLGGLRQYSDTLHGAIAGRASNRRWEIWTTFIFFPSQLMFVFSHPQAPS
jgi:hypothetical protein